MGEFSGSIPTILGGYTPLGDDWDSITDLLTALTAAPTVYVPTWTASAGSPSVGNGTLTGAYRRIGKHVDFVINLVGGSSSNYGTAGAYWAFGLPALGNVAYYYAWPCRLLDAGTAEYTAIGATNVGSATVELFKTSASGRVTNNGLFTFGTGDMMWINGSYALA